MTHKIKLGTVTYTGDLTISESAEGFFDWCFSPHKKQAVFGNIETLWIFSSKKEALDDATSHGIFPQEEKPNA